MKKGFTLIEILVVVIIVGILAGMAVPIFTKALEDNRARVAENNLRQIHIAERLYAIDHNGEYGAAGTYNGLSSINSLLDLELNDDDYDYVLTIPAAQTTFTATATRTVGGTTRTLTITQTGPPVTDTSS